MSAIQGLLNFYTNKLSDKREKLHKISDEYNYCKGEIEQLECFVEDLENELKNESEDK